MIVQLRGTSGSGKTWLARQLLAHSNAIPTRMVVNGNRKAKPEIYGGQLPDTGAHVYVLGSYETACGGCDTIPTQDRVCELVREYWPQGHVLFEGLICGHLISRYSDLAHEIGLHRMTFAFLDTPVALCLERVQARRRERGDERPLNPRNTVDKWHDVRRGRYKLEAAGCRCVVLPVGGEWPALLGLLT